MKKQIGVLASGAALQARLNVRLRLLLQRVFPG